MREVRWSGVRRILLIMSLTKQSRFSTVSNGVLHHPPTFFFFFSPVPHPCDKADMLYPHPPLPLPVT